MCFSARKDMISIETHYFSLNRILLLSIGLWPHQKSKLVLLQFISVISILTTFVIVQVRQYLKITSM